MRTADNCAHFVPPHSECAACALRETPYCCVSLVVVCDAFDKAASCGMLPRRHCDAPSASKNEKPLLSVALYHQHILFAATAEAAAVWVMCVSVCVIICRVSSPLRHLHFQNAHKKHARSVKGNVEATRFITAWLRIHTCWVVNPSPPACALSTHPVFASDQTLIVGFSS